MFKIEIFKKISFFSALVAILILAGVIIGCQKEAPIVLSLDEAIEKAFAGEISGFRIHPDGKVDPFMLLNTTTGVTRLKSGIEHQGALTYDWNDRHPDAYHHSTYDIRDPNGQSNYTKALGQLVSQNPGKIIEIWLCVYSYDQFHLRFLFVYVH